MRERRAQGFTLIELLVVIAIAALLLALVAPTGRHRRDHEALTTGAHEIASALRLTRSRAILANQPTSFIVDVGAGFYRPAGATAAVAMPRGSHVTLYTAQEEALSDGVGAIRFYPDGSSTGGGIALSLGRERVQVLVDWLTGGVSIHEQQQPAS
jgi:general secretion pathway protein H